MNAKWLLIDADDTLWENGVYFERVFEEFVELLGHSHLSAEQVRAVLDEIELEAIRIHGYGTLNFARNLRNCYQTLAETPLSEEELDEAMRLAHTILDRPIELLDGVVETLEYLNSRYHLTLFSKGQHEEQHAKVDRSGVEQYFHACQIVREKDAETYRQFVVQRNIDAAHTWMVGNSPKSDINPALEAGLGAVLVPHAMTWSLEHEDLPTSSDRFQIVERFSDLQRVF
ncbi:MAG: HAD family hydrolase [Acidobacteria bacterium]|nr:HAD family hydrolase [Acidobacteriota bacterium]